MDKLFSAIKTIFPTFSEPTLREEMVLGEIDEWDSMNSITLDLELEAAFDVDLSEVVLTADHKISDVRSILAEAKKNSRQ